MVFFTCNHCGDSLQKPKVEKHYSFVCRRPKSLTCVDCLKDFRGEEYSSHIKCVTEDERYGAKGTVQGGMKKGEIKQESWMSMIENISKQENLRPQIRNLLNTMLNFNNVPRKKPKFMNFMKSSSGGRVNMKDVEEIWDIIEKYKNDTAQKNGTTNVDNAEEKHVEKKIETNTKNGDKKSKKKKITDGENNDEIECKKMKLTGEKFSYEETILEILNVRDAGISLKKLEKKVLKAYKNFNGGSECNTEKIVKKIGKKLKKIDNVEVDEQMVKLIK